MSIDLSCCTFNVRGIRNDLKRQTVFQHFRKLKSSFVLLQETHSTIDDEKKWKREWGGNAYFAHGTAHSSGVAILFKPNCQFDIQKVECDPNGKFLFLKICADDKSFILLNIYAPNKDKEQVAFYTILLNKLQSEYPDGDFVIGGDFNVVLNHNLDKKGGIAYDRKSKEQLKTIIETIDLCDIWRSLHPVKRTYTWHQNSPFVMCRLDFFLISKSLVKYVKQCEIIDGRKSDHRIVRLKLSLGNVIQRGPGFWKLNNSLLEDKTYVQDIKEIIQLKEVEYNYINDARVKWELMKFEIKSESVNYSKRKAKIKRKLESELESRLGEIDVIICNNENPDDTLLNEYCEIKKTLDQIAEQKTKGAIVRSRADWIEHGEKSSEYFFSIEKKKIVKKIFLYCS